MHRNTKKIAISGIMSAIGLLICFVACIMPSGWVGVTAVSGFSVAITVAASGVASGWAVYCTTSLLALLLLPVKSVSILYSVFMGIYPIIKFYTEKLKSRFFEYISKFIFFDFVLFLLYKFAYFLFFEDVLTAYNDIKLLLLFLIAGLNIVFIIYDYAFSKVMAILQNRLVKQIKRLAE